MITKICTNIKQSKKLAEILPLESADMSYSFNFNSETHELSTVPYKDWIVPKYAQPDNGFGQVIPCWSLAALIELMPERIKIGEELSFCLTSKKSSTGFSFGYNLNGSTFVKDNPIDAAFKMICWLKENDII